MPIIKSAEKRLRQSKKRHARNLVVKHAVRAKFKLVRDTIAKGKIKDNKDLIAAIKELDKAVKKGVIKSQTAARKKSRLTKAYNSVAPQPFGTELVKQRSSKKTKSDSKVKESTPTKK